MMEDCLQRFVSTDMSVLLVCEEQEVRGRELKDLLVETGYLVECATPSEALQVRDQSSQPTTVAVNSNATTVAGSKQQELQRQHSIPDLVILLPSHQNIRTSAAPSPLISDSDQHTTTRTCTQNFLAAPMRCALDLSVLRALACNKLPPLVLVLEPEEATSPVVLRALEDGAADVLTLPLRRQEACMLWQHVYKAQLSHSAGASKRSLQPAAFAQQQPPPPGTCTPSEDDSPLAEENEEEGEGEGQGQEEVTEGAPGAGADEAAAATAGVVAAAKGVAAAAIAMPMMEGKQGSGSGSGDSIATLQPFHHAGNSLRRGLDVGDCTWQQAAQQQPLHAPHPGHQQQLHSNEETTPNGGGSGDSTCMEVVLCQQLRFPHDCRTLNASPLKPDAPGHITAATPVAPTPSTQPPPATAATATVSANASASSQAFPKPNKLLRSTTHPAMKATEGHHAHPHPHAQPQRHHHHQYSSSNHHHAKPHQQHDQGSSAAPGDVEMVGGNETGTGVGSNTGLAGNVNGLPGRPRAMAATPSHALRGTASVARQASLMRRASTANEAQVQAEEAEVEAEEAAQATQAAAARAALARHASPMATPASKPGSVEAGAGGNGDTCMPQQQLQQQSQQPRRHHHYHHHHHHHHHHLSVAANPAPALSVATSEQQGSKEGSGSGEQGSDDSKVQQPQQKAGGTDTAADPQLGSSNNNSSGNANNNNAIDSSRNGSGSNGESNTDSNRNNSGSTSRRSSKELSRQQKVAAGGFHGQGAGSELQQQGGSKGSTRQPGGRSSLEAAAAASAAGPATCIMGSLPFKNSNEVTATDVAGATGNKSASAGGYGGSNIAGEGAGGEPNTTTTTTTTTKVARQGGAVRHHHHHHHHHHHIADLTPQQQQQLEQEQQEQQQQQQQGADEQHGHHKRIHKEGAPQRKSQRRQPICPVPTRSSLENGLLPFCLQGDPWSPGSKVQREVSATTAEDPTATAGGDGGCTNEDSGDGGGGCSDLGSGDSGTTGRSSVRSGTVGGQAGSGSKSTLGAAAGDLAKVSGGQGTGSSSPPSRAQHHPQQQGQRPRSSTFHRSARSAFTPLSPSAPPSAAPTAAVDCAPSSPAHANMPNAQDDAAEAAAVLEGLGAAAKQSGPPSATRGRSGGKAAGALTPTAMTRGRASAMELGSPIASGARTRRQTNGSRGGGCGSAMDVGSPITTGARTRNMSGSGKGGGASAMDVASPAVRYGGSGNSREASPPRGSCSRGGSTWHRQQGQLPALLQAVALSLQRQEEEEGKRWGGLRPRSKQIGSSEDSSERAEEGGSSDNMSGLDGGEEEADAPAADNADAPSAGNTHAGVNGKTGRAASGRVSSVDSKGVDLGGNKGSRADKAAATAAAVAAGGCVSRLLLPRPSPAASGRKQRLPSVPATTKPTTRQPSQQHQQHQQHQAACAGAVTADRGSGVTPTGVAAPASKHVSAPPTRHDAVAARTNSTTPPPTYTPQQAHDSADGATAAATHTPVKEPSPQAKQLAQPLNLLLSSMPVSVVHFMCALAYSIGEFPSGSMDPEALQQYHRQLQHALKQHYQLQQQQQQQQQQQRLLMEQRQVHQQQQQQQGQSQQQPFQQHGLDQQHQQHVAHQQHHQQQQERLNEHAALQSVASAPAAVRAGSSGSLASAPPGALAIQHSHSLRAAANRTGLGSHATSNPTSHTLPYPAPVSSDSTHTSHSDTKTCHPPHPPTTHTHLNHTLSGSVPTPSVALTPPLMNGTAFAPPHLSAGCGFVNGSTSMLPPPYPLQNTQAVAKCTQAPLYAHPQAHMHAQARAQAYAHTLSNGCTYSGAGFGGPQSPNGAVMSAHRQAALAKYLFKRNNRSFTRKVRYESRKKLAEARLRVRGQFVKQQSNGGSAALKQEDEPSSAEGTATDANTTPAPPANDLTLDPATGTAAAAAAAGAIAGAVGAVI